MSLTTEKLYNLLPAIYRIRDAEQGEPLKALIAVLAEQAAVMEEDIAKLNENWFIETCEEWVVPYIGDLLGVRGLHPIDGEAAFSHRARVANTIRYRRRKGTATVLEQLAYDTTGWRSRVVEFFELLETTQYANHIRLHSLRTPDLRQTAKLELLNTAFDTIAHTADVRHIKSGRGLHNIPNIGLYLWRLQSYAVTRSTARPGPGAPAGCYTFSPLGLDQQLFNRPQTESEITHLAEEINVPGPLRRRPLYDELEARRKAIANDQTSVYLYFDDRPNGEAPPVLQVFLDGSTTAVPSEEILICDLSAWQTPPDSKSYDQTQSDGSSVKVDLPITVAVDPVLGRLALPSSSSATRVNVSFAYGFSGDMGGGPYDRRDSVDEFLARDVNWQVGVSKDLTAEPGVIFNTLAEAIAEWNTQPAGTVGVIAVMDSQTYEENLTGADSIQIPEGSQLLIVSANWPEEDDPENSSGTKTRIKGHLEPDELRPHILGNVSVIGIASASSLTPGKLGFNGVLIEGSVKVLAGNLGELHIAHSTLLPSSGGLRVGSKNDQLTINLTRTICGPIKLIKSVPSLEIEESIVDGASGSAIFARGTSVEMEKSTVLGESDVYALEASNSIFTGKVRVVRAQIGCLRFSYVPVKSSTPRRYRCQPDYEIAQQTEEAEKEAREKNLVLSTIQRNTIRRKIVSWLVPSLASKTYGDPAYCQLSRSCPKQIRTGADDGSEMGAFSFLKQPQRQSNLENSLEEYLRFGLEAGIIFVT